MIEPKINLIALFCYGSNNIEQVRARVNNQHIQAYKGLLPNYRRIFADYSNSWGGGIASIMYTSDPNLFCRGSYVLLTQQEIAKMNKFEGITSSNPFDTDPSKNIYRHQPVLIQIENGNFINGITYIKNTNNWISYPSISYLNACYKNIKPFWSNLDGNNYIMYYDNKGKLKGKYIG